MSGNVAEVRDRDPLIQLCGLSCGEGRPGRLNQPGGPGHYEGMEPLRIVKGDATAPQGEGNKIIAHVCNDRGGWGKGFVLAISRRWPEPERTYRQWHRGRVGDDFGLGTVQLVAVQPDLWVANMVAQHGCGPQARPLRSATTPWSGVWRLSPAMPAAWAPPCTCPGSAVGLLVGSGS